MRNAHGERAVHASYNVHTQEPRFSFFGRKVLARVGINTSLDSDVWICIWGIRSQWINLRLDVLFLHCTQYGFYTIVGKFRPCCGVGYIKLMVNLNI